jgi:amino acid transporter
MAPPTGVVYVEPMAPRTLAPGLRAECLSYPEVLAQSVSVIAPSTVPAAVLGLIFATAGNGTWLAFLIGMLGLTLVSLNINQFARHSSSSGSLYSYIVTGLGPTVGLIGGCGLLFGYMVTGMSTLCGFAIAMHSLLAGLGLNLPPMLLSTLAVIAAFLLAAGDIRLSSKTMLLLEGAAIAAILALGMVVLRHKGFVIDRQQLTLHGVSPGGVLIGVVLVVFGFSGFESSTSLGDEAKDPLRSIPRSVTQSVLISGGVFIFMAYVVVLGFQGLNVNLATTELPLSVLSNHYHLPWLGELISVGVVLSFFSCTLGSVNATGRIIFSMARHNLVPSAFGKVHARSKSPYVAIGCAALLTLLVTLSLSLFGISDYDGQGYFGTLCSFGFLVVYMLISAAAPVYLAKRGKLTKRAIVIASLSVLFMLIPILGTIGLPGSSLFPPPAYPSNILVWMFVGFMVVSVGWLTFVQKSRSSDLADIFEES